LLHPIAYFQIIVYIEVNNEFWQLLSSLLHLGIHTHSLQALEYFFMLAFPFSYQDYLSSENDRP